MHRLWQAPLVEVDPDVVYFRSRLNLLTEQQRRWLRDLSDICGFRAVSDPPGWLRPDELEAMEAYLAARPEVRRLGRYRFALDGREVDFTRRSLRSRPSAIRSRDPPAPARTASRRHRRTGRALVKCSAKSSGGHRLPFMEHHMATTGTDLSRMREMNQLSIVWALRGTRPRRSPNWRAGPGCPARGGRAGAGPGRRRLGRGREPGASSVVGRPARRFRFRADAGHVLGIDIGVHKILVVLSDLEGNLVQTLRRPVDPEAAPEAPRGRGPRHRRGPDGRGMAPPTSGR
ncbi:hypothetical protein NKH77_00960 [Streptomyces sp. M19]